MIYGVLSMQFWRYQMVGVYLFFVAFFLCFFQFTRTAGGEKVAQQHREDTGKKIPLFLVSMLLYALLVVMSLTFLLGPSQNKLEPPSVNLDITFLG
mmetsp:Transcript_1545/g.1945  ORF Transcript_1545/g.1945 Transcript_1545/m.1945 type:complete len:96 (+) Transcript_1545:166-453(+)